MSELDDIIAELRKRIPAPHRPPLLDSERGELAKTLRAAGKGVLALDVIHKIDELAWFWATVPLLLDARRQGDDNTALRKVLTDHWLTAIECNHADKTDTPRCYCSVWQCPPQPSVGAAVQAWIDHVLEQRT